MDAEAALCRVALEKLAERDTARVEECNRQLADAAEQVLRGARRSYFAFDLASALLARDLYHDVCPPDPMWVVLYLGDDRFVEESLGTIGLATKWDALLDRQLAESGLLEAFEKMMGGRAGESRPLPGSVRDLEPWLVAVGYGSETEDAAEDAMEDVAEEAPPVVYRLRIALKRRPERQHLVEVRSDQTLGDLDRVVRQAFRHDSSDHLSEFLVPTGRRQRKEGLGEIYPGGTGAGAEIPIAELDLEPGDGFEYLYDFGDWIEHTVTVEAVVPPEPGATYPRQLRRTAKRGR